MTSAWPLQLQKQSVLSFALSVCHIFAANCNVRNFLKAGIMKTDYIAVVRTRFEPESYYLALARKRRLAALEAIKRRKTDTLDGGRASEGRTKMRLQPVVKLGSLEKLPRTHA
ncbi:hypothetical protein [Lutimaribacter saemankumensis]|uniref:hypothetical protein n=1 Tax=Lutimaribacter saemankumensis TaxID=490829 RepID=UPI0011144BBE|nr:hypothetical protein [Lutimaribacter saemankumensis]